MVEVERQEFQLHLSIMVIPEVQEVVVDLAAQGLKEIKVDLLILVLKVKVILVGVVQLVVIDQVVVAEVQELTAIQRHSTQELEVTEVPVLKVQ